MTNTVAALTTRLRKLIAPKPLRADRHKRTAPLGPDAALRRAHLRALKSTPEVMAQIQ